MKFVLSSQQFSFDEGDVFIATRHPAMAQVGEARLRSNVIESSGTLSPGTILLTLTNVIVTSRTNGSSRRMDAMMLQTPLSNENVNSAVAEINIEPHAIVRIQVVGDALKYGPRPEVGFYGDPMFIQRVNEKGFLDVLLPVGRNKVYLGERPSVKASFDIVEGQEDAGTVLLRATE